MDVDDFIWLHFRQDNYARFVLMLLRLPAANQLDWEEWISKYKLFCDYEGARYRVTVASRMGDIGLARDHSEDSRYDVRVSVDECSKWGPKP